MAQLIRVNTPVALHQPKYSPQSNRPARISRLLGLLESAFNEVVIVGFILGAIAGTSEISSE
jgi:hypothetical protein